MQRERERDSFADYSYVPSIFEKSVLTRLYFVKSFVNAFIFFFLNSKKFEYHEYFASKKRFVAKKGKKKKGKKKKKKMKS